MTEPATSTVHGTCIRVGPMGVLIIGPSGSGKSDLALRLIDQPGRGSGDADLEVVLIADDRVVMSAQGGALMAAAPDTIQGMLEVRSVGIIDVPVETGVRVGLVVNLSPDLDRERIPDFQKQTLEHCGVAVPELRINPFEASAPAKVRAAVTALHGGGFLNAVPGGTGQ